MNMITMIDPPTWHDQRPTHGNPPEFVMEARAAALRAWQNVSELTDKYLEYQTDIDTVNEAVEQARAADAYYHDQYAAWQRGEVAGCTCTPSGFDTDKARAELASLSRQAEAQILKSIGF